MASRRRREGGQYQPRRNRPFSVICGVAGGNIVPRCASDMVAGGAAWRLATNISSARRVFCVPDGVKTKRRRAFDGIGRHRGSVFGVALSSLSAGRPPRSLHCSRRTARRGAAAAQGGEEIVGMAKPVAGGVGRGENQYRA